MTETPRESGSATAQSRALAAIADAFALDRRVVLGTGKGFGSGALKVDGKIFAMISSKGQFVAKLPSKRVDAYLREGIGQRFDAGRGRQMQEWLALDDGEDTWIDIAREARLFVGGD